MDLQRIMAIMLIIAGSLGLAYGGFSYTKDTRRADGRVSQLSVDDIDRWRAVTDRASKNLARKKPHAFMSAVMCASEPIFSLPHRIIVTQSTHSSVPSNEE